MKKLLFVLIIGSLFLTSISAQAISSEISTTHPSIRKQFNQGFIFNIDDSHNILLSLDMYGRSYGHELLWKANTTVTNYEESAVVYVDGIAYISSCSTHGDGHDKLFAVNTSNGDILWSTLIGPGYVGPVIDEDYIYVGTSSHGYDPTNEYIYCINRWNGNILWERNIFGGIPESIQYDEQNIYFTSNLIYALDKHNGDTKWTYPMDSFSVTKPILKDNAFYTATSGGYMYKVDIIDGSGIWSVTLSDFSWDNSITADGKGRIYLALYGDNTINAYNETTGSLLWSYRLHAGSLSFNAFYDNVIYISDTRGYVYALNATTGALLWENKIGNTIDISSPSISCGLLFIGTRDFEEGALFILNATTGEIIWKYTIGASVTAPPSIADGILFCGTDNWHMYAFDIGIGNDDWLIHRYDSFNTAYSPNGLTEWQYLSAECTTENYITTCIVQNSYDHDVTDVKLKLPEDMNADWYDSLGNLLQTNANYHIINNISTTSTLTYIITNTIHDPMKPTITGPTSGKPGIEYFYNISTNDPDNDPISYFIDWGDGANSGWTITYPSGELITVSHTWSARGSYEIKAKAKDIDERESEWNILEITMPKGKFMLLERLVEWFPMLGEFLFHN